MPKVHFIFTNQFLAERSQFQRFKNIGYNEFPISVSEANNIMHIALLIGKNILKGNAVPDIMGPINEDENRSKISISTTIREEVNPLFNELSAWGTIKIPIGESP